MLHALVCEVPRLYIIIAVLLSLDDKMFLYKDRTSWSGGRIMA